MDVKDNAKKVHEYIEYLMTIIRKPPMGKFPVPSLATTAGEFYAAGMFTWDTHHMTMRYAMGGQPEMMKYFLDTMFLFQRTDGFISCVISADNGPCDLEDFHAQPYLAQNAAIYLARTGDLESAKCWIKPLEGYINYWLNHFASPMGLFHWGSVYMSGFDNEITGDSFPPHTTLPPDLPSLLYLECRAMAYLLTRLNQDGKQYEERAAAIKAAINETLWDEDMGTYTAYNLITGRVQTSWSDGSLNSTVGKYAYVSCPALLTLFAGTATPERAKRMIETYVLSPEHFRSKFGIRSLSKSSEYYNNARWGNPPRFNRWNVLTTSNWQGPVWIPLNWFVFHGLLRYGFRRDAELLAQDTTNLLALALERQGFFRENFHAETGEGLYADQFASWDILGDTFQLYLDNAPEALTLFPWE